MSLESYMPVEKRPFSDFTFSDEPAPHVMAYVMSDLSNKHVYNLAQLKLKGCQHLIVFAEHLTVPAMCELLRTHVDDVVLMPFHVKECERLQDTVLPLLGECASDYHSEPDEISDMSVQSAINFEEIIQVIEEHFCAKLSLARISKELNLSPSRVSHLFKDVCGIGFRHYLTCRRLEEAETLLTDPKANITSVAFGLGFSSPSHFCRAFKESFGLTPTSYIAGNRQFTLDEKFSRYQHLRLTILPHIHKMAHQVIPPVRMQLRSVG